MNRDRASMLADVMTGTVVNLLELMEICGEECEGHDVTSDMWMHLVPGPFRNLHSNLYRAHVRELVARAPDVPFSLGTEAEVLVGLVVTSQKAPLTSAAGALYARLFRSCMGDEITDGLTDRYQFPEDVYEGQLDEMLHEARRQVRNDRPRSWREGEQSL